MLNKMYTKGKYLGESSDKIIGRIKEMGFDPQKFTDPANYIYEPHKHKETKLLVFLDGEMKVVVDGSKLICQKGDELMISSNTTHSAKVGRKGCTFLWSEKLV